MREMSASRLGAGGFDASGASNPGSASLRWRISDFKIDWCGDLFAAPSLAVRLSKPIRSVLQGVEQEAQGSLRGFR